VEEFALLGDRMQGRTAKRAKWVKGKWKRIKDKGKRIKGSIEQGESNSLTVSYLYPLSFILYPNSPLPPA
jgi:hypothetical protein